VVSAAENLHAKIKALALSCEFSLADSFDRRRFSKQLAKLLASYSIEAGS
jgi:hypothetical protein